MHMFIKYSEGCWFNPSTSRITSEKKQSLSGYRSLCGYTGQLPDVNGLKSWNYNIFFSVDKL